MAKRRTHYECGGCGYQSPRWLGRCPDCQEWNTLVECLHVPEGAATPSIRARPGTSQTAGSGEDAVSVTTVSERDKAVRLLSGIGEFDRIVGGGLVPGSITLVGGEPGVGKSTLLLQVAMAVAASGHRVLYASGEESVDQVSGRAQRLGPLNEGLLLQSETDLGRILASSDKLAPDVLVVDSVQTVFVAELGGTIGNVAQVREVCSRLVQHAKSTGRIVLVVGHVTKGGQLAGPRTLEHLVDTVIYFEGGSHPPYRVLRAEKNRFGATGELGLFEMTSAGLRGVAEPSAVLLQDRPDGRCGTVVTACMEGSRSLLLEVQSLVAPGFPGSVRRSALGVDSGRLAMLVAVLAKAEYVLHDKDVFVNVVGGLRITETAADLAVAAAIVSSLLSRPVGSDWLVLGEVGLTGEVRQVARMDRRLEEARRHGFLRALVPRLPKSIALPDGLQCIEATSLEQAMQMLFYD